MKQGKPLLKVRSIDRSISKLKSKREQLILDIQDKCNHPVDSILEMPYKPSTHFFHATPNARVCCQCGYAEEGWGCGFWKLNTATKVPEVDRSHAMQFYVLKMYSQKELSELRFKKP